MYFNPFELFRMLHLNLLYNDIAFIVFLYVIHQPVSDGSTLYIFQIHLILHVKKRTTFTPVCS
jgi:hypothetical protein